MFISFLLAFFAAFANAASSLLQRKANMGKSRTVLLKRPVWLLGVGVALVSFVLQAGALSNGSLAAIEPVLALELVLVVLGSGIFFKTHIGKQEWVSVVLMTAGTAGLIAALNPQKKDFVVITARQWVVALGLSALVVGGCCLAAYLVRRREHQAALLGVGTGAALGLTSSLLKDAMLVFKHGGIVSVLSSWELYAALAVGIFTFWLLQVALRSGKLVASQPGITLADPFMAIGWGAWIFQEKMNTGVGLIFALVAALALGVGAVLLARAPALEGHRT